MEQSSSHRWPIWVPLVVAIILGGAYIGAEYMKRNEVFPGPLPVINVSGEGRVTAVPDIAQVSFGVKTGRQKSAEMAMQKLRKDMNSIMVTLSKIGVDETDIATESFWLNPAYDWIEGRQISRGFEANQNIRVKIRDTDTIGQVLTAATSAGANQAGSIQFTIDDPEALRARARKAAIMNAKDKAEMLAVYLDAELGDITGFYEDFPAGAPPYPPFAYDEARAVSAEAGFGGGAPLPLPEGQQEIVVRVNLSYELD